MIRIEILEVKGVSACSEGCCHVDGLLIDKMVSGEFQADEFIPTENSQEIDRIVKKMVQIHGDENVNFTPLKC